MARANGQRLPDVVRRRGVRQLQNLLAVGIEEAECCEQIAASFNVTPRTARSWLAIAYDGLSKEAQAPRDELLGLALKRRRLAMSRAAKDGDWRTFTAAADSEAKLLGLNAPVQTEHHVLIEKVSDMSKAVVEVVREFFADRPDERARFVLRLRERLNAQLSARPEKLAIVIDEPSEVEAVEAGNVEPVEATGPRTPGTTADVAPTAAPAPDGPSPA